MSSTLFILRAWQSSRTTCLQVLFGLALGIGPSTSYSIHFFTQSSSFFRSWLARNNAACSAAIPMLCHLYLVSLSTLYLGVCLLVCIEGTKTLVIWDTEPLVSHIVWASVTVYSWRHLHGRRAERHRTIVPVDWDRCAACALLSATWHHCCASIDSPFRSTISSFWLWSFRLVDYYALFRPLFQDNLGKPVPER